MGAVVGQANQRPGSGPGLTEVSHNARNLPRGGESVSEVEICCSHTMDIWTRRDMMGPLPNWPSHMHTRLRLPTSVSLNGGGGSAAGLIGCRTATLKWLTLRPAEAGSNLPFADWGYPG